MLIYLIEDDTGQARNVSSALNQAGYAVEVFRDGATALRALQKCIPDAIVLDRKLPDMNGLEVLRWVRRCYRDLPVLVLTGAPLECDLVEALQAGADDYVAKPAKCAELTARVMALLRRTQTSARVLEAIELGSYLVDRASRQVYVKRQRVQLSPKEYEVFELLVSNIGRVIPRDTMMAVIWGRSAEAFNSRTLDTHIYRLRRKLDLNRDGGLALRVIYGHGFQLERLC
ncbi:response regulator transcription factor [Burkholderia pseudomallei]|uniref:response regulator transcription factor n=1 Tax=Burkholderia pseudomallei TaxID=28450 RepID=UPI001124310B|nr:response regulator transcription factor [Burkholderia pseudomallei]MBO2969090.1 response regulator transcription factor [Burkholderia pseudomallei]TOZ98158.1 DNA-binding response regulator [Burkholderia pseudomallei]